MRVLHHQFRLLVGGDGCVHRLSMCFISAIWPRDLLAYGEVANHSLLARLNLLKGYAEDIISSLPFSSLSSSEIEGDVVDHRLSSESLLFQRLAVLFGLFLSAYRVDRVLCNSWFNWVSSWRVFSVHGNNERCHVDAKQSTRTIVAFDFNLSFVLGTIST